MDFRKCASILVIVMLKFVNSNEHKIQKRYTLLYPRNTLMQFSIGWAMRTILRNKRQFVVASVYQQRYDLPSNLSDFNVPTYYTRSIIDNHDITRETLYVYIMNTLDNLELDGEQCLLRAVCDVAHTPFHTKKKNSILEKIAQFIFTPSISYNFDAELEEERGVNNQTFGENLLYAYKIGRQRENCKDIYPNFIYRLSADDPSANQKQMSPPGLHPAVLNRSVSFNAEMALN